MEPPIRRVLAIDAGSRRIKLLLAQSRFGRCSILNQEMIDLQAEGLVSAEELQVHLQETLDKFARPPLALALPQHVSTGQAIELPIVPDTEVDKLIHEETLKLSGLADSRIVYDFVRIGIHGTRQRFWIALSQEGDIRERSSRLGVIQEDLCDVTTTANALLTACRYSAPGWDRTILIHLAAQSTVLAIMADGQPAFSTSFPVGGDFVTRALVRAHNISEEAAEALKQKARLDDSPDPALLAAVDSWAAEVSRQLDEWFTDNPQYAAQADSFRVIASGGGFDLQGLLPYAESKLGRKLHPWPVNPGPHALKPEPGFEVAFGTALQALGHSHHPVSLMPQEYRAAWNKRLWRQRIEIASVVVLAVCVLMLALGTWRQLVLIGRKESMLSKVRAAQEAVELNNQLTSELVVSYESLRPVSALQQNTIDTLRMLSLIQASHTSNGFWYVLLADQQTYFSGVPWFSTTNAPAATNAAPSLGERKRFGSSETPLSGSTTTNASPARPGYIAEVTIPGEAEAARATLSRLVNGLKEQKLFAKVDLLSEDLRQELAEPKVVLPDSHFALALDFAQNEFHQPVRLKKPAPLPTTRPGTPRRTAVGRETSTQAAIVPR